MTQEQLILFKRSINVYNTETEAWTALDNLTHIQGQPVVAFFRRNSDTHGDTALGAIFAIGTANGVGKYKACSSHDDMLAVLQALNTHISEWTAFKTIFDKMFTYDADHNAIKANLDFYTDSNKNISAGGLGGSGSSSLGALYQLIDVMINSTGDGVEGAVEGSVLAYDAIAGKWKAIAQSEILPDMSGYYTKDETDSAINTAKSNLQGQVDTLKALIPATATADNQLADKDFVNSSIATATAEFRGSFTSLDELKATSGNLNDYAFYLHTDDVGNKVVDRYKWTTAGWLYEYTLNNSSFTAEQWAALNSAITATLVNSYNSHLNNSTIHITAAERTKWNNKWDYNEETIKAVKVNAAVSADKLATARKIWGQSFDGSADVSGNIIGSYFHIVDRASNPYFKLVDSDGQIGYVQLLPQNAGVSIGSASTLSLTVNPSGNVLIGTLTDNGYKLDVNGRGHYSGDIVCGGEVVATAGEGTPAGVTDYSALTGKPQINGVTLVSGDNTLASLGIQAAGDYATNSGVTTLLADYATKTFVANNYAGKAAFNTHIADRVKHITDEERTAWNAKWTYDEATIKAVKVTSASSADSVAWSGVSGKPTSLKNPYALTFGSKSYDGSAAATITASDLGALTAHQSIYALTLQVNSVSQGTYNPASAAKTINIAVPTKTSDITNDSGFITSAAIPTALKNPYAVEIKANGVSLGTYDGSAAAIFNLSAANVGAASKVHSHTASDISGLPTNLSAFTNDVGYITGITKPMVEGVLTGNITSHTHSYLPLNGGTMTGVVTLTSGGYSTLEKTALSFINSSDKIEQARIGTNSTNDLGLYATGTIYIRPNITFDGDSLTYGLKISSSSFTYNGTNVSLAGHTHTFSSLTSKPTTLAGYGITDAYTSSTIDSKLSGYLSLSGGTMTGSIKFNDNSLPSKTLSYVCGIDEFANGGEMGWMRGSDFVAQYAPTLKGTGASGTWRISISGNAASATKLQTPRTIWGQSFDGTGSIWGDLNMRYNKITFGESANDYHIGWGDGNLLVYKNYFGHYFVTNNTERMRITIAGNVLIGTTTDSGQKLQVAGSIVADLGNNGGVIIGRNGNTIDGFVNGSLAGLHINYTSAYNISLCRGGGNVLIGTTTDNGYKLQVNGSERVYGDLIVDGEVSALVA